MKRQLTVDDYYPAPFWFINHKLEKDEISRQLQLMKEQRVTSFFIHPRAGLLTPYGSREFCQMLRHAVEEAERLGMEPWLYDEDPYPSGQAGGRIIMDNPEFAARELQFKELSPNEKGRVDADLGVGRLLEAVAVRLDDDGGVLELRDLAADVGVLRRDFFQSEWRNSYYAQLTGRVDYFHYRAETYYPRLAIDIPLPDGWKVYATVAATVTTTCKYDFLPDNLNPECVKAFIRLTHEKYKEALGDKFGSVIPGIFTDETATGGVYAWTPRLEEEFARRRSFPLKGSYFRIFRGRTEEDRRIREAYWRTVQELFIDSFYKPVNEWCERHALQLCGHGIAEEDPLATTNGMNIYALQKHVGIPGFDHITPNIPDGDKVKSLNLGGRLVASAAAQNGEPRVQSECFACNAYNFGHDGMKKIAHWLYSLGVTWLVPHGFHYSYDGYRKDDAGKSFFFQDPDYDRFHLFADHIARLGHKLGSSRSMATVCILYPVSVFRRLMPAERALAEKLRSDLYDCVQFMLDHHVQFELADDDTLLAAPIEDGKARCGKCSYRTIVAPFAELDPQSTQLLARLAANGVEVLRFPDHTGTLPGRDGFSLKTAKGDAPDTRLMTLLKNSDEGRLLYVFSNQATGGFFDLRLEKIPDGGVYIYDPDADKLLKLNPSPNGSFRFELAGYDAKILVCRDAPMDAEDYRLPEIAAPVFAPPYEQAPQWNYSPPIPGIKASLSDWHIAINGQSFGRRRYTLLRDVAGTNLKYLSDRLPRPHFDVAKMLATPYPARAEFEAAFTLSQTAHGTKLVLLAESETFSGSCAVLLNGVEIPAASFKRVRRYDPWNIEADVTAHCRPGDNQLIIRWDQGQEFDGLRSLIYVVQCEACPQPSF